MSQCTKCEKIFSRKDSMMRHMKSQHTHVQHPQEVQVSQNEQQPPKPIAGFIFKHPFTSIVSGPTSCGKTTFVKNLLKMNNTYIQPRLQRIIWLYKRWQPLYDEIIRSVTPKVEFMQGLPDNIESDDFIQPNVRNLVIIDDLATVCSKDSRISELFTEGSHHRNLSIIMLNQNLYHSKNPTERRNCQYLVLFKNPMDKQAVMTLARQMYPGKTGFFLKKFDDATAEPFSYLLVDLKADTKEKDRFQTDILAIKEQIEPPPPHSVKGTQRDNNCKEEIYIGTMDEHTSKFIPLEKETYAPCDDCGMVFENIHDLQRHVKKWCPDGQPSGLPTKRIKLEEDLPIVQELLIPDAELPVYEIMMKQSKDENEELWKKRVTKYMHEGLSEDEAVEKADKKMEGSDMDLFMKKYSSLLLDILHLSKGSLHQKIMATIQDNIKKKYKEEKAVKLALRQVRDEIQDMMQEDESDSESENEDPESDENEI